MQNFIRKQLPMMFAFFAGVVILVAFFSGKSVITNFRSNMQVWVSIIGGFTLLLGVVSITSVNFQKVRIRARDWPYKLILLICLAVSGGFGIIEGTESGTVYDWLFQNMVTPMMSSMFAMLAFFIAFSLLPRIPATSAATPTKWTVMVYMAADNDLEAAAIDDFLEMAEVTGLTGRGASVRVLVQLDRAMKCDLPDPLVDDERYDNWTSCRRYEITTGIVPDNKHKNTC